jgi:hypothetical protein
MNVIGSIGLKVEDAAGNTLGGGLVFAQSAGITETLDGAGSWSATFPLSDERARTLLTNERRVTVYLDGVEVGGGIIRNVEVKVRENSRELVVSGPDLLNELQRVSTLRGRTYDNTAIGTVVSSLVGLASGWSASVTGLSGVNVHLRFDGQSVLKSIGAVAEAQGVHFRKGTGRVVEVGAFGGDSGLWALAAAGPESNRNAQLVLIEDLRVVDDSSEVVNWIIPLGGGGGGDAAMSLKAAYDAGTRTTGLGFDYDIQTMTGPDGRTLYYLRDTSSISSYGQIEAVRVYSQIRPLSNNDTDLQRGSEALYDIAAVDLGRVSQPLQTLSLSVRPAVGTDMSVIKPGNKLRVAYQGVVETAGGTYTWLDVDADYWIMEVRKSVNLGGVGYTLKVASVDRVAMDAVETVVGALEQISVNGVTVAQNFDTYRYTFAELMDSSNDATIPLNITSETREVTRVLLRLQTRPFRATASSAASGGGSTETSAGGGSISQSSGIGGANHNHIIGSYQSTTNPPGSATYKRYQINLVGGVVADVYWQTATTDTFVTSGVTADHSHTITVGSHTHQITIPSHTHALNYGINQDTSYPSGVTVTINGVDRTSALGGPWGTGGAIDEELDITEYINAAATLRQEHTIVIGCSGGQGVAVGQLAVQQTVASVDASV